MATSPHLIRRALTMAGVISVVASLSGLILGLTLISAVANDLEATVRVSHAALEALDETVAVVEDVSTDAAASLTAAADSSAGAATTVKGAIVALEGLADLLDTDLPDDLESLHEAMPATIRAASAVDAAVGALSSLGVGSTASAGLEESFRRLEEVLGELPAQLRIQGGHVRSLLSPATALSEDVNRLALSMESLREDLNRFEELSDTYRMTLTEAREAVQQGGESLERRAVLMRVLVTAVAAAGVALGATLIMAGRGFTGLVYE